MYILKRQRKKVDRIRDCKCTHFIDDLPEILEMIDGKIVKVLYCPKNREERHGMKVMSDWTQLQKILDDV